MTTKAVLSWGEARLELEGSEDFVTSQLQSFGSKLIHTKPPSPKVPAEDVPERDPTDTQEPDGSKTSKKARRSSGRAGPSCAARIMPIIAEGFFITPKKNSDVEAKLKERATPYERKHVSASLIDLVRRNKLRRYQENGQWVYVNP